MKSTPPTSSPPYQTSRAALEREVVIERYRSGGPGGQHRNVTDSAVRLWHPPSGVCVTAADSRSQAQNLDIAFERLTARLESLNRIQRPRVATRPPRAKKERRLTQKRRRGEALRRRGRITRHDDE
jgi:protein subunit release factor A